MSLQARIESLKGRHATLEDRIMRRTSGPDPMRRSCRG